MTDLESAVSLYTGDLLEGVDEGWCEVERSQFRTMYLSTLKALVLAYRDQAAYQKAVLTAHRIVAIDPMDEDTYREL
ncbi:MAG TPA: bacterial transcriptional activator domain-containing protein, partial [Nitrospiraceae bacterium]|nr:bacterial transcriptional activator domain-containing protein [Nitrospiraceae bacterium]